MMMAVGNMKRTRKSKTAKSMNTMMVAGNRTTTEMMIGMTIMMMTGTMMTMTDMIVMMTDRD